MVITNGEVDTLHSQMLNTAVENRDAVADIDARWLWLFIDR
jgi:hypothetical protein